MTAGFGLVAAAVGFLKVGILGLGKAFLMNPIGLAIAGIATAAYLIYDNWEPIFNWMSTKFEWFSKAASGIADFFGFGGDTKIEMGKTVKNVGASPALGASAQMNEIKPALNKITSSNTNSKAGNITNSIRIEVNNPSSDVDVERAVQKALQRNEQSRKNRSFSDEEI